MNYKKETLYGAVRKTALNNRDNTALYYKGKTVSFWHLLENIDRFAAALYDLDIGERSVVTICLPNTPECVYAFYALNKLGAAAHMVHPQITAEMLKKYMAETKSSMLITLDKNAEKFSGVINGGIKTVLCSPADSLSVISRIFYRIFNGGAKGIKGENVFFYRKLKSKRILNRHERDFYKSAVYLHSGGTTGQPKVIALSSYAINSLCVLGGDILSENVFSDKSMLAVLPMFHGFGLAMGIHAMLIFGGCDTLMPKFHTKESVSLIKKGRINYIIGVPALYEALLKNKNFSGEILKNLKCAFVGGDFVRQDLIDRFNRRISDGGGHAKLYEGYGLTETVTVCSVNRPGSDKKGSVGRALSDVEIAAFDDLGQRLAAGNQGELYVSGDQLMNGYLGDKEATEEAFYFYGGKKWVKTGDFCFVDEEGFVFFKSRKKCIVKVSGVTVLPREVEMTVCGQFPYIDEVVAAPVPDAQTDNKLVLFVTLKKNIETDKEVFKREVADFIENKLSVYARPKDIIFKEKFLRTAVGKIDSDAMAKEYLAEKSGVTAEEREKFPNNINGESLEVISEESIKENADKEEAIVLAETQKTVFPEIVADVIAQDAEEDEETAGEEETAEDTEEAEEEEAVQKDAEEGKEDSEEYIELQKNGEQQTENKEESSENDVEILDEKDNKEESGANGDRPEDGEEENSNFIESDSAVPDEKDNKEESGANGSEKAETTDIKVEKAE